MWIKSGGDFMTSIRRFGEGLASGFDATAAIIIKLMKSNKKYEDIEDFAPRFGAQTFDHGQDTFWTAGLMRGHD